MRDKHGKIDSSQSVPLEAPDALDINDRPAADRQRMLVIDDSDLARREIVKFFRARGWLVASARGALAAIDLALTQQPHVVVTELRLPDAQGCHFVRSLRAAVEHDLHVVAVTSQPETTFAEALAAGIDLVLAKPADVAAIEAAVTGVLSG